MTIDMDAAWKELYEAYWRWAQAASAEARRQADLMPDEWKEETRVQVMQTAYATERDTWIAGYNRLMQLSAAASVQESHEAHTEARQAWSGPEQAQTVSFEQRGLF